MWVTQTTQTWKKKYETWSLEGALGVPLQGSLEDYKSIEASNKEEIKYCEHNIFFEPHTTWIGKGKKSLWFNLTTLGFYELMNNSIDQHDYNVLFEPRMTEINNMGINIYVPTSQ
jgi:hypothetical protein